LKAIYLFLILFFSFSTILFSQTATIKGVVKDQNSKPIENVSVEYGKTGTTTNVYGEYLLEVSIPKNKKVTIKFNHVSFNTLTKRLSVRKNGTSSFSPKLSVRTEEISDVIIDAKKKKKNGNALKVLKF